MNYPLLYKQLGARIEKIRHQKSMTQEEVAEKAGMHHAYFSEIVQGRNISVKTAHKIAHALGIKLSELFDI